MFTSAINVLFVFCIISLFIIDLTDLDIPVIVQYSSMKVNLNTYISYMELTFHQLTPGVAMWVSCLTRNRWMPVSREFEPHQRLPLFLEQETLPALLSTECSVSKSKKITNAFLRTCCMSNITTNTPYHVCWS